MFPRARTDHLTVRELGDETLVYDRERHKGHCLNRTAALVWCHCDGRTSLAGLAQVVADETSVDDAAAVVGLALEQLGRRGLLVEAPTPLAPTERVGRREALRKLAFVAAVLPLVLTIATKTAAQSISEDPAPDPPPDPPPPPPPPPPPTVTIGVGVNVEIPTGSSGSGSKAAKPSNSSPCRTRGQSCLAGGSGQQGTCCAGLTCTGVSQGAGVCG